MKNTATLQMSPAVPAAASSEFFSRNRGLLSADDQQSLSQTTIAIAGAGGDGGLLAERLVRMGVGHIILADPEVFEPANINRQFAADHRTLGRNKAEAVAEALQRINPALDIKVYTCGVTPQNVMAIVSAADLIVDEIEYSLPALSVLLHREARREGKYVFMGANIGWGASVFCFDPRGVSFEDHFEYDEALETINPLKYLDKIPAYFTEATQQAILSGTMPMPAVSSSVSLVSAIMTTEIVLFLTGRRRPLIVPRFLCADLFDFSFQKH